jgi:integrase
MGTGPDYIPKLRPRKGGGSVVTLNGRDHYCGPWGSAAARAKYDGLIRRWLDGGRRPLPTPRRPASGPTVADVCRRFRAYAAGYYGPNAKVMNPAVDGVERRAGTLPAADFGPAELRAVRNEFVARGCLISYVNDQAKRVRLMFKWAAGEGIVPPATWLALTAVANLKRGRGACRERPPRGPAPADAVAAVLADRRLPAAVAGLIRLQLATGMRPGEACGMRAGDVDRSAEPWAYRPPGHKGTWLGREKVIYLGPRARAVVGPRLHLLARADGPLFTTRRGTAISTDRYGRQVARACVRAGVAHWSPHQLRKARSQEVRDAEGAEAAAAVIGDDVAVTLKHYARSGEALARRVAEESG